MTSFSASRPTSPAVVVTEFGVDHPVAPPRASPLQAAPRGMAATSGRQEMAAITQNDVTDVERSLELMMVDAQPASGRPVPSPIAGPIRPTHSQSQQAPPPSRGPRPFVDSFSEPIHQSSPKLAHTSPNKNTTRTVTSQSTGTSVGDDNVFMSPGNKRLLLAKQKCSCV